MDSAKLPLELLRMIIDAAVWTLPLAHLVRLRLVSSLFKDIVMETIVKSGLLDTIGSLQLVRLGDNFKPDSTARLRLCLHHKLRFGTKDEYFVTIIRECMDYYCRNTESSSAQEEQVFLEKLLDAASMRRLHGKQCELLTRKGPIQDTPLAPLFSSSSNHVLAAMAFIGDERLVRLYIERHELDLRMSYAFGGPLQCAASQGHLNIVKLLIEAHGDIETLLPPSKTTRTAQGKRLPYPRMFGAVVEALCTATLGGHVPIINFLADLLYLHKDASDFKPYGLYVCRYACMGGHEFLLGDLVVPSPSGVADSERQIESRLLQNRTFVGQASQTKDPILTVLVRYSVAFGLEKGLKLAVANGFDLSHKYHKGHNRPPATALVHASAFGRESIVRWLLQEGAGCEAENKKEAIVMASRRGFRSVVQTLLDHQSNDLNNSRQLLLEAAFRAAAEYGQVHIIELLFSLGLNIDIGSEATRPVVAVAMNNGWSCVPRTIERLWP